MAQAHSTAPDTSDDTADALDSNQLSEIKKKSISGVISFTVRTAVLQGIGLLSAVVLSAFFSPEDFGIYGFVIQIIGILIFFSDIGLAAALIQKKDEPNLAEYRTAFTIQQLLSWMIVGIAVLLILSGLVEQKTGWAGNWILLSLAVSFPIATLKTIPSVMLERKLDFSKLVVPQIFEQLMFHGLLLVLAWKGMGAIAYAYAISARAVVGAVVMMVIQPWSLGLQIHRTSLRSLLQYGAQFQANDFLARIKDQLFFLALGWFLPLREFGYISWAKNWSLYPYNLTVQNVMAVTFPTFSRLQHNKVALGKAIEKSLFFISLSIFPILVGMSVFIAPLIAVIPQYAKWQPAVLSLILFSLSIGWGAVSTPLTNTLNAIGKITTTLKLMLFWTTLTWLVTPALVWWLGFNGVALSAFLISFTSLLPIMYVKRHVAFNAWDQVWRQLLAAGVMGVVGWAGQSLWSQNIKMLLLGMTLVGSAYIACFAVFGGKRLAKEVVSLKVK